MTKYERHRIDTMADCDDPLAAARGIWYGLKLALALWGAIALGVLLV